MKKLFNNVHIRLPRFVAVMLVTVCSCQEALEERYLNPARTTVPEIELFFTKMLDNNRIRPSYWEMSTFINWHIGVYTQSVGFLNGESVYQQNDSYITNRWDDFYRPGVNGSGTMALYREIEKAYAFLSEEEKKEKEVFLQAARVLLFDQTSQMVDLWGDVPYKEAGMLNITGDVVYPQFDDAREIYDAVLHGLKDAAVYFSSAQLSSSTQTLFSTQDILLGGEVLLWERYTNALRLRLLMRISFVDEERSKAQVLEMLQDPDRYPLPGAAALSDPETENVLLHAMADYTDDLRAAFTDWTNYPAPYFLVEEVLKPANDPRLEVLFDKYGTLSGSTFTANTDYEGMPLELSRLDQQKNLGSYAIVDSSTVLYNSKLPGVVFTAAEVNFLKAEAYERWGGGDPEAAYTAAIKQSVDFYYYLNSLNNLPKTPLAVPSEAEKETFLTQTTIAYAGTTAEKLSKIWTQKWAHFGFLQAVQSWAELRRTGYPQLSFRPSSLTGYELPPSRLMYPGTEKTLNKNYAAVATSDTRDGKIFWDVQ